MLSWTSPKRQKVGWERLLRRKTNSRFLKAISLPSFLYRSISAFRALLKDVHITPRSRRPWGGRLRQISVDEHMHPIKTTCYRTQRGVINSPQSALNSLRNHSTGAKIERSREKLNGSKAYHQPLSAQLSIIWDNLDHEKMEFSTLLAAFYCLRNASRPVFLPVECKCKKARAFDFCGSSPFVQHYYEKDENYGIES